jgi:hypothetical protein
MQEISTDSIVAPIEFIKTLGNVFFQFKNMKINLNDYKDILSKNDIFLRKQELDKLILFKKDEVVDIIIDITSEIFKNFAIENL